MHLTGLNSSGYRRLRNLSSLKVIRQAHLIEWDRITGIFLQPIAKRYFRQTAVSSRAIAISELAFPAKQILAIYETIQIHSAAAFDTYYRCHRFWPGESPALAPGAVGGAC
jgi:hypothetical protein